MALDGDSDFYILWRPLGKEINGKDDFVETDEEKSEGW